VVAFPQGILYIIYQTEEKLFLKIVGLKEEVFCFPVSSFYYQPFGANRRDKQ
jgi:hypothetical protein